MLQLYRLRQEEVQAQTSSSTGFDLRADIDRSIDLRVTLQMIDWKSIAYILRSKGILRGEN